MLSPGDQVGDFLSQLPLGLFVTVCGSLVLLFAAFSWFAYFKPLRNKRNNPEPDNLSEDLPDLDFLVDPSSLEQAPAAVVEKEPTPPPTQEEVSPLLPEVKPPEPVVQKSGDVQLNTGEYIDANPVASVLRDPRDGRLIVQIDGVAYRTLIDTPDVKKRFVKVMRELSTVVTEPDTNPPTSAPPSMPVIEEEEPPAPEPPVRTSSAPPPPVGPDGAMPGDLPKYNLDDSVEAKSQGLFGRAKYEAQPIPEFNIAASIEAYLQHKLRHTPEYAGREIHVHSAPGGTVRIQVDDAFFDAVDEVSNPQDRAFIAEAIQEWQERQ